MKNSLPEAQNIWKTILAIVAGALLMWDSCSLKGAPPNASLTDVLLRFLVFTITWLGGFFSLARTNWRFAMGAIGLSSLFPIIAVFSSDTRVSSALGGGMLFIDGPRGILSIMALILVASTKSCFAQENKSSAKRETIAFAWLIIVQSVVHQLMNVGL